MSAPRRNVICVGWPTERPLCRLPRQQRHLCRLADRKDCGGNGLRLSADVSAPPKSGYSGCLWPNRKGFRNHLGEQRFQLLVNSVTDYAIYMLDPEGHIATWNPGARRFKGYEEAERSSAGIIPPSSPTRTRRRGLPWRALEIAEREGRFESEGWRVRKDGTRFWAHVVLDPVRDADGTLLGFAKITRDISEQEGARSARSTRASSASGCSSRACAIMPSTCSTPTAASPTGIPARRRSRAISADEIVGQHFSRFYTEEDRANGEPQRALETALREGKYEKEAWRVRKDGTRFWASVRARSDLRRRRRARRLRQDHPRHHRAAQARSEELEEARAALFQSQKLQALGELTGGIAHDFNNLMTVIRGSAELLRRGDLPEAQARPLSRRDHRDRRPRRHADQPSARLRPPPGAEARGDRSQRPARRVRRGARRARSAAASRSKLDLAPELWLVEVDPAQLETALLNAAFNARDAMPEGGRHHLVHRATSPGGEGGEVCVAISRHRRRDERGGARPRLRAVLHDQAGRQGDGPRPLADPRLRRPVGRPRRDRVAEPARGRRSACFCRAPTRRCGEAQKAPEARSVRAGATILVVEDNDQVREFAVSLLGELGYRVVPRRLGRGGAACILDRGEAIDIVFSDVVMPGLSGVDLAKIARGKRPGLPILLASGYSEEIVAGAGASFDFVRKPYDAGALDRALQHALDQAEPVRA